MENLIVREPTTAAIDTSVPISSPTSLSPVDDDHISLNPRSPSFSTDFLERNAGADLNHSQPLRVHSLVRKLGTAALAQNSDDGHSSRSVAVGSVAPDAPFALRPGVLDLSEDEGESEHEPQQEVTDTDYATDGLSEIASTVADTRPIIKTSRESTHASIFGPSSSTAAYGPAAAAASASPSASVSAPASASASASESATATASVSTPAAAVQQPIVQAPDASAAIGTMPTFPRGIGPAPGETGFSGTSKKPKTKKFSFLQLLRLKPKAPPEAPAAMSAAEKRALAAKERDNRIKEAEAAKRRKAATPTDIAPSRNPAVVRTQKEELLGRKKSHLREAKTELTLAQKDVELLMESIGELEEELATSAPVTATATV
ncbi:hypothetical protein P167DRAFT_582521 [Morchella conica CCBAS932]|uniref:Uncharacterized protein n=1 Tax=Morchella conica CCBAS932 TaxID=1392247 RepID=A0A3N4KWX0_9PEZI|nr:hypothetical protein P167DRAFT_582521 [Morchella conica CCBAS932]